MCRCNLRGSDTYLSCTPSAYSSLWVEQHQQEVIHFNVQPHLFLGWQSSSKCPKYFLSRTHNEVIALSTTHHLSSAVSVWCLTQFVHNTRISAASLVDALTHPGTFLKAVCVCDSVRMTMSVCGGEQQGSVEAQRWQVDPHQSPLSLQGSNCSRPQTLTCTPPTVEMLPSSPSYTIMQFKGLIGVSWASWH